MTLREELESELSFPELLRIAKRRGLKQEFKFKEDIVSWLLQSGLTWKEYELNYNPYITLKFRICKFLGIRKGWRIMDVGCGSGGTSVAAASLVGREGKVLAIDHSEKEIIHCTNYVKKVGFEGIVETKLANVLDLEFENGCFDMILLIYSLQFLGYLEDFKEVLLKIKNWTNRIGIADHIPVPSKYNEGIYLLFNWLRNDLARVGVGKKTDRLFHTEEIRNVLSMTGWEIVREREFEVSKKNSYPVWAMKENIRRLSEQIDNLRDPIDREIFSSRLQTIKDLTEKGIMPKPTSMFVTVAESAR